MTALPQPGDAFAIAYPFVRDTYSRWDEEGSHEAPTWKPGIVFESCGPYGEDVESFAHGEGLAAFTVVASFKPGHYPARVFFTRRFKTPDGKWFGKSRLHIVTLEKFRRLTKGYLHPYSIRKLHEPEPPSAPITADYHGFAAISAAEMEGREASDDLPF